MYNYKKLIFHKKSQYKTLKKKKNKNKSNQKDCLLNFYSKYNLTPWIIKATPIRAAAKRG